MIRHLLHVDFQPGRGLQEQVRETLVNAILSGIFAADTPLPPGKHQVRMEFAYEGEGLAGGGAISLCLDGRKIGGGCVGATMPMIYSLDETMDVGCETGSMVTEEYDAATSKFNGRIAWVQLDQGVDDYDHLISPEERWHVAMTRQ